MDCPATIVVKARDELAAFVRAVPLNRTISPGAATTIVMHRVTSETLSLTIVAAVLVHSTSIAEEPILRTVYKGAC